VSLRARSPQRGLSLQLGPQVQALLRPTRLAVRAAHKGYARAGDASELTLRLSEAWQQTQMRSVQLLEWTVAAICDIMVTGLSGGDSKERLVWIDRGSSSMMRVFPVR
jgi:hypothetical protein